MRSPLRTHLVWVAAAAAAMIVAAPAALAGQARAGGTASPQAQEAAVDPEAEPERGGPVLVGGEPVVWVTAGSGPYTPQVRAARITQRVTDIVHDRSILDPTVTVTEVEGSSELRVGPRLLMVITQQDARSIGVARAALATQYAHELEAAIREERLRYAPGTLIRSGIAGLLATVVLVILLWLSGRLMRWLRSAVARVQARRLTALVQKAEVVAPESVGRAIDYAVSAIRLIVTLLVFDLYLTYVLGLFPWTRVVSRRLLSYVITPVQTAVSAFVGYLPNLLFLIVIGAFIHTAIRLVRLFFEQIEKGRLVFKSFPPEWATPTNKIVRVLLLAFGVVVAFPYLPASDSAAFAGVSVFMGILFSLSSSSAISNIIAGVVLTYTGAFRLGDRVKLGDAVGDIIEMSLLATHIRTIKNEHITIPNSIALNNSMTNYCRTTNTSGLILHTSVTIGYDAPWRQIHDLLIGAALSTPGLLHEPRPFVWQTALNDFYVSYEINAYTATPHAMPDIYAALHAAIQDAFYAAGVEIMSPHFTAIRDGNTVAIPESARPPGYRAPAFRVENSAPLPDPSRDRAGMMTPR